MTDFALPAVKGNDQAAYELLWPENNEDAVLLKDGREIRK